jgi:SAM-dependent methyltransferase
MRKHPQLVEMLPEAILRHGPRRFMDYLEQEKGFDTEHHTETCSLVQKTVYPKELRNLEHGSGYQAAFTDVIVNSFDKVIRHNKLHQKQSLRLRFVDIGSGKGKALIIAHSYPFETIVGIEYNQDLCEVARRNLSVTKCGRAELFCEDILEYDGFGSDTVYFAFNPFDEPLTKKVAKTVECYGNVYFIYNNPTYKEVFRDWQLIDRTVGYCPNRDVDIYYRHMIS